MPNKKINRDLEFLYEMGSLRNVERGWRQHFGVEVGNVLEHTMRTVFLALILARKEGIKNEEKIIKMAMIHDLAETRVSDLSYVQKVYVKADEDRAAKDLFSNTGLADLEQEILKEYEERNSLEAKIVKDADNLEVDLELKELAERGSRLPAKWAEMRKFVRDTKLYTDSARSLWDEIQSSDVSSWHLGTNKWLKIPEAGK